MKWAWISIGGALIVAITVISCCMIYVENYTCSCLVWALYILLVAYFIVCSYLIMKKMQVNSIEKIDERQCKTNESTLNSFITAVMKDILALQKEMDEVKYTMKANIKKSEK